VLGIGLLIGAIVALIMNWDTVVKFVTDVWNGFMGFLSDSFGYIADWWNELWSGVGRFLEDTWNNIVNFFKGVLGFVVDLFLNWTVYGFIIRNWETIRTFIVNLWGGIVTFFQDTLNNVGGFFESVFTGIGDFVRGIFDGMIRGIKGYVNALIDLINGVIGGINNVGSFIRDITGGAVNVKVGKIPRLAKGGFVDSPTTALIGEAGPEVVTPLRDFERMMGLDGNGRGNTVNYYAAPNQSIDAEQALFTAMKRAKVLAAW
jgi:phage-related protein